MIKEIVLPDLGEGIESATISEIPLSAGEHVKKDDVLLVLESDKASMEIPSDYDGKLVEVLIEEGKDVATGEPLFKIEIQEGSKEKIEEEPKKEVETKEQREVKVESKTVLEPNTARVGDDVFASPGVRRLARELGIDLGLIKGTGAKGRTTKEDLHSYIRIKMQEGSGLSRSPKSP
jgi:Pyruvate/2-oxoglutarate dehydrogenase complex, dihydrolipoamide acyltransferase (E2) component, and related enzymes